MGSESVRLLKYVNFLKTGIGALGVIAAPISLVLIYQTLKLKVSSFDLNLLELERQQHGYIECTEPLINGQSSKPLLIDDDDYISGPTWRGLRPRRAPKYWAKMAKSGGILPKSVAIDLLSRLHDLPDGVYYSTALACDPDTLVALARKRGTDMRFFIEPLKTFDEKHHLSYQLYCLLRRLLDEHSTDPCTKFYAEVLLGRLPELTQEGESSVELDDYEEDYTERSKPRPTELKPPMRSLASLTLSTLDIIWHHTVHADQRRWFLYENRGLQLLTRIWYVFRSDETVMCKLANIVVNLSEDLHTRPLLVTSGFLHPLASWLRSDNTELVSTAASILANLSATEEKPPRYQKGCYLLNPIFQPNTDPRVDVVFIHGINGRVFYTWRQHSSMKGDEDYTNCWPRDWLSAQFGPLVRVIGVEYVSRATYWQSHCPFDQDKQTILEQAKQLAEKLQQCQLGNRPIVWVGHSLGGLIIKQLLSLASEELSPYKSLASSTKHVIFLGVPHKGSPMARMTNRASYLLFPAVEIQQLLDAPKLSALDERFTEVVNREGITCKNYIEGLKTQFTRRLRLHIVPEEFAVSTVGENIVLYDEDHMSICKPRDENNAIYRALSKTLYTLIGQELQETSPVTDQPTNVFPHPI